MPIQLPYGVPPTLAVGAHLKNTVAIAIGDQAFLSQHIGDLETEGAYEAFKLTINDFQRLYDVEPERVVCEKTPGLPVDGVRRVAADVAARTNVSHVV